MEKVMVSLASLLTDPNCSSPMNGEAAKEYSKNRKAYDKKVKEWVALHAKSTDVSYENDFGDGKPSSSSPTAKAKSKAKASPKKSPKAKSYDFFFQRLTFHSNEHQIRLKTNLSVSSKRQTIIDNIVHTSNHNRPTKKKGGSAIVLSDSDDDRPAKRRKT
jgi:hypothetical protein